LVNTEFFSVADTLCQNSHW